MPCHNARRIRIKLTQTQGLKLNIQYKEIAATYGLHPAQAQQLFIVLTINPFERLPSGEPDMEENPPRHPFTRPSVKLNLLPAEQVNIAQLRNGIVIGKINFQNGELQVATDFIPPCTSMNSMPVLADWHKKFRLILETWETSCLKLVQKINSKTQTQQPNVLANNIQKISEKILEQLVKQKTAYQWIMDKSAPIFLCMSLMENIQYAHTILQCFGEKDREEMLNYFAEWTDTQAGMLENQTLRCLQLSYNHYDNGSVLNEITVLSNLPADISETGSAGIHR